MNGTDPYRLQYAAWGSTGSQLVFIHDFSVYYAPSADYASDAVKLLEGSTNSHVYHLFPDWIYRDGESPVRGQ